MSEHAQSFIAHLSGLAERDRGALAALRRSLAFDPGAYPPAYPYVERFVGPDRHADDPRRQALYLTAGLFALHPKHQATVSLAGAFGTLAKARGSASIEQRFVALLGADPEHLPQMLRQAVSLLMADGSGFDFARLLDDLARWLDPYAFDTRDSLRQRWARDFYRAYDGGADAADAERASTEQTI
jgi:CRISPR system Cascade subunit CasB